MKSAGILSVGFCVAGLLAGASVASGAALTFDANTAAGGAQDGSGIWTNGAPATNWWNGLAHTNWNNAAPDSATFGNGGNAGTVTLASAISAGNISFGSVTGANTYLILSNTLTLVGTPTIDVLTNATINSVLAGSSFIKTNIGMLTLGGANSFTGTTLLSQGIILANNSGALGVGPIMFTSLGNRLLVANNVNVANSITIGANTNVGGRGLLEVSSGTGTVSGAITINNGAVQGGHFAAPTAGTRLNVNGAITSSVAVASRLGLVIFSGGGSYSNFTLGQDTVGIGANNGISTSAVMNVAGSGAGTFDLRGFNQTLAGISNTLTATIQNSGAGVSLLTLNTANFISYTGVVNGGVALLKTGVATQSLVGTLANTFTGGVTVAGGTLLLAKSANVNNIAGGAVLVQTGAVLRLGADSQISDGISSLTLIQGTFDLQSTVEGISPPVTMTDSVVGGAAGAGFLLARGGVVADGTNLITKRYSVRGTDATSSVFRINSGTTLVSGPIYTDSGGVQGITKAGSGRLELGNVNTFAGGTIISNGTLVLNSGASLNNSTNIRVASGAVFDVTAAGITLAAGQTLQGEGTVLGQVVTDNSSGNSRVLAGGDGTPGTLSVTGDLIVGSSAYTNHFDLTNSLTVGGGVNDLLAITGMFEPNFSVIRIRALAPLVSGSYRLINYATGMTTPFTTPVLGNSYRDTWTLDTATAGQVNLTVASGTNFSLVWSPVASGDWDILTTANWTNLTTTLADTYADNDRVLFNDSGTAFPVVNLVSPLKPAVIVVNSASNYVFSGAGKISDGIGALVLVKDGAGSLTITTTNDYSGGTVVSNGSVVAAALGALGAAPVSLSPGSTLELAATGAVPNVIGGSGTVLKTGAGVLTLTGASTYTGPTIISGGVVVVSGPGTLGAAVYPGNISNAGSLQFNGVTQTLAGVMSGAGSLTVTGAVSSGSLTLNNANTFTGLTLVSAGALTLASTNGPALAGPVSFDNNLSPDIYTTVDNQFAPGTVLVYSNNAGDEARFDLLGTTQTLAGIHTVYAAAKGRVQNREFGPYNPASTGALLVLNGTGNYFFSGYLRDGVLIGSNKLGVTKTGSGTQTMWGTAIDYSGPTIVGAGSLVLTNVDDLWSAGGLVISNGASLVIDTSARVFQYKGKTTVTGGGSIVMIGGVNSTLWGNNGQGVTMAMDPGALLDIRAGLFRNEFGAFNNWTNNYASLGVSNGASFWIWDANTFVDALNGAGFIDKGQANAHFLTVGNGNGSGTFNGVIRNTTGSLSLVKSGLGVQTLGGVNSYSGTTTVAAGTLALSASGSITGTPRIIVATSATFDVTAPGNFALQNFQSLEGGGLVTGSVAATTGSKIIPGTAGAMGTLSFGNALNLTSTTTNYFDLANGNTTIGGGINDLVNVGGLLEPSNAVIAISVSQPASNGTYRLFNYVGTKSSVFSPVVGNTSHKSWALDEATPGQVNLTVSGAAYALVWRSQVSSNWDLNVSANFLNTAGGTNSVFLEGDTVLFDDSGAATNGVGLVGTLRPGSLTVNSASNYFFTGLGKISGLTGLTKDGAGTLSLVGTTNDFSGPATISGGAVSVSSDTNLGAYPAAYSAGQIVLNGGTLKAVSNVTILANRGIMLGALGGTLDNTQLVGGLSATFNSIISGSGPLALNANNASLADSGGGLGGNLHLGVTNTFSGAVAINAGVVSFVGDGAFGNATNVITLNGGGLVANANRTLDHNLALAGGGDRFFRTFNNILFTVNGGITGNGNIRRVDAGTNVFNGNLTYTGSFINAAATTWLLGTNTYTGGTILTNASTLIIRELSDSGPSGIANSGLLTFSGGTLRYDGSGETFTMRSITNLNLSRVILDITNSASTVLLGGTIGGTGGLTKLGPGTLVISNNQVTSFQANPGIELQRGTLLLAAGQINSQGPANFSDYIGRNAGNDATMTLAGSSAYNRSNAVLYIGDATGAKGTFNIQDNASFWGNFQVRLGQNAGATGIINQTGGSLTVNASDLAVGNSGLGLYYHQGGSITNGGILYVGINAGSRGAFYQNDGPIVSPGAAEFRLANVIGSYGYFGMTGGSMIRGNWLRISEGGLAVYHQSGGTNTVTGSGFLLNTAGGTGVVYMTGGMLNTSNLNLIVSYNNNPGGGRAEMTVAGSATVQIGANILQLNKAIIGNNSTNFLNLNGGLVVANSINAGTITNGLSVVSFNGGTLRAHSSATLLSGLNAAYIYSGGATIDSSTNTATITQALLTPTGNGVSSISITGSIGGYVGAPHVSITGGGGGNATAAALFDYVSGSVTGIVMTGAGIGYSSAPTVTLTGGNKTTDITSATATIGANTSGGLTKLGSGALLLSASNTYTGATLINAGNLYGTGSVNSAVTINNGASIGPSYTVPLTGTFTVVSSLTIANGGTLSTHLRGTSASIRVTGDFNVSPTSLIQLVLNGPITNGTHVLVDYDGSFVGNISDFSITTLPSGSYLTNNLTNTSLDLVITNSGALIKWNGLVDATWMNLGPLNWKLVSDDSPAAYAIYDNVLFDDAAAANYTVDVTTAVTPSTVTINNTNKDYTFTGAGSINGGVGITKAGPGMMTLATPSVLGPAGQSLALEGGTTRFASDAPVNGYNLTVRSGVTLVSDRATPGAAVTHALSTLLVTNTTTLFVTNGANVTSGQAGLTVSGRGDFTAASGATVDVGDFNTLTILGSANSVPNSVGVFNKNGRGTLIVSGANSFWDHSNVAINSGTTIVRNASAFNETSTTPISIGTNATFQFGHDGVHNNHFNMTVIGDGSIVLDRATPGTGLAQNNAILTFNAANTLTIAAGGNVTSGTASISFSSAVLGGDSAINVVNPANAALTTASITGLVSQTGGARSLTKNGSGTLTLRPTSPNNYTGGTVVNGGVLVLAYSQGAQNLGTIIGTVTVNTGATVRSTVDKGWGFSALPTGGVQTVILNGGILEHAAVNGHGSGQTIFMTAGEIRSNGGTNSTTSGSYRIGSGADPTIYVLASASTSLITGRVAMDTTGRFDVEDGAADVDLLITATITDGIGASNPPNGIVKSGLGTLILTSSNTYSRTTIVSNGTLLVHGSISTDAVTVVAGATLGGTGTIAGTVTSSGTVAPGARPGVLTLQTAYVQNASATLAIELAGTTPGTGHDKLAIGGTATLGGALTVTTNSGFLPAFGNTFTVLTASVVSGTFTTTNLPALADTNTIWNVTYFPGAVVLSVTNSGAPPPPTGYTAWSNLYVLTTGPEADQDGDGYANLLEYVTGANPTNTDTLARMNATRTNGLLALKFTRDTNTVDATLIVEGANATTNNATWTGIATNLNGSWGGATNIVEGAGSPAAVTAYDTDPATNRFLRLRVTRP